MRHYVFRDTPDSPQGWDDAPDPDPNDPFGPAGRDPAQRLRCLHCDGVFTVAQVKWEPSNGGIWVCPSWPECDGAGIGFDLHPA